MKLSRDMLEKIQVSVEDLVKGLFVSANTKHLFKMSVDSISALTKDELSLAMSKLKDIGNGVNSLTEIVGRILNIVNRTTEHAGELKSKTASQVPEDAFEVQEEGNEDKQIPCCYASATTEYDSIYILNDNQDYANCVSDSKNPLRSATQKSDSLCILKDSQEYANCASVSEKLSHSATNKNNSMRILNDNQERMNCVPDSKTSNHDKSLDEQFIFDESNIKVVKELGRGNFATTHSVVLMSDEGKGTKAAWKVLKTDKGNADVEESKKETMFLMMVGGQENIMRFIGITLNAEKGNLGFLTEMCERGSLDTLHHTFDLLEPNRFWKIVTGVFLGLMHLHLFKIVHRDIACRNILIGGDWTPKLSDFGLSVRAPSGKHVGKVNEKLPVFWMSPEALLERTFTYKSDVWAAGVMVWEILWKGKKPYIDDWEKMSQSNNLTMRDAMRHVLDGIVSKKIRLLPPPNTSPECANLLRSCLAFAPSFRPDAFEVLEHLVLGDSKSNVPGGLQSIEEHGTNAMKSEKSRRAKSAIISGAIYKSSRKRISLKLHRKGLSEVPGFKLMEIGKFAKLVELGLNQNQLTSIPAEIGNLAEVMFLYLYQNQLTSIPAEIGNLTELKELNLNQNQLTSLPAEIGKLTELEILGLYENKLVSLPAEIGKLTKLSELCLIENQLTSLPAEIGNLRRLKELMVRHNQLTSLPAEIGKLTWLEMLPLYRNQLTSLPAEIGKLTKLDSLLLYQNQLTSLPAEIGKLTNLDSLLLHQNKLTSLPAEIGKLTKLQCLNLNENQLNSIPAEIGKLTNLDSLLLHQNKLTSLPAEIGKLTKLQCLNLNENQLNSIPAEIGKLTELKELNLNKNQLTSVPAEIGKLTKLRNLHFKENKLTSIPAEIEQFLKLRASSTNNS